MTETLKNEKVPLNTSEVDFRYADCHVCHNRIGEKHPFCSSCGTRKVFDYKLFTCECETVTAISGRESTYCPNCGRFLTLQVAA
jgi:hypothetical protein